MSYSFFFTEDESKNRLWLDALNLCCYKQNFHNKFQIVSIIGRGAQAVVIKVEKIV
jgi:hypothetical protein